MKTAEPIHTKLYAEDAFRIINLVKKMRGAVTALRSLTTGLRYDLYKTCKSQKWSDYSVIRAPDGEVIVSHRKFTDSIGTIKRDLKNAINLIPFKEDEPFVELRTSLFLPESVKPVDALDAELKEMCKAAKRGMRIRLPYERFDEDFIKSHPFTKRRLRKTLEDIGTDAQLNLMADPFKTEQRKFIYKTIFGMLCDIQDGRIPSARIARSGYAKLARNEAYDLYHLWPLALEHDMKQIIMESLEEEKTDTFCEFSTLTYEQVVEDAERFFSSDRWKQYVQALEMMAADEIMPCPSSFCDTTLAVAYAKAVPELSWT